MNLCPTEEQFQQLLAEQIGEADRAAIERHIETCGSCRDTLARLTTDPEMEKYLRPPGNGAVDVPAELLQRLKEHPPAAGRSTKDASNGEEGVEIQFPGSRAAEAPLGELGKFAILKELGHGTFGSVYLARDRELGRDVAIKVLRPELAADAKERARFEHEARAAASIENDHVVRIYEVGKPVPDFLLPYFVTEYVEGESLSDRLRREGLLEPKEAAEVVRQAATGLHEAHGHGLLHRDVKPGNILLEARGDGTLGVSTNRAKIADFGLARPAEGINERISRSGQFAGTPAYMSPEQINVSGTIDSRSDVYSLGVVLYEALTGVRPFRGRPLTVLDQIVHRDPEPPSRFIERIPRDVETITLKCLAKEPGRRYQTASELADDLQRFLDGKPILARPMSRTERAWRLCRRHPARVGEVVLVVFLVTILVTWHLRAEKLRGDAETAQKEAADLQDQLRGLEGTDPWQRTIPPQNAERDDYPEPRGVDSPGILLDGKGYGLITGKINWPGDFDYFQFIMPKNGPLLISATALDDDLNVCLRVYHYTGAPLAKPADERSGKQAQIVVPNAVAGRTYLVGITGYARSVGKYRIEVAQSDDHPDRRSSARPVGLDSGGRAHISGAIEPAGDEDWFTFTMPHDGLLIIKLETRESSLDPHLRLHNEGALVIERHDYIERSVVEGQTYWLNVRAGSEKGPGDIGPGELPTGRYMLTLELNEQK